MSVFFLSLSLLTYFLSHWWARKSQPSSYAEFELEKLFSGNKQSLMRSFHLGLKTQNHFSILAEEDSALVLEENAGFLHYGGFVHIRLFDSHDQILVKISYQPKLIGNSSRSIEHLMRLFEDIEWQDAG